ncbi:MAG: tyrosine-type recombinase/integrase [Polyangiaceae bacterium]|nr:tyrosine-type recombinase/integrase [Polyangiaceae bacterium]
MHSSLVPLFLRRDYEGAVHKTKIDARVSELLACGYTKAFAKSLLREWLCFLRDAGLDASSLPDIHDDGVGRYLRRRCRTRKEGVRGVRAALRLLLCDDAAPGTMLKKRRASTPLFESVVPGYIAFARQHRGARATRTPEVYLRQFFLFLDAEHIAVTAELEPKHYRAFLERCATKMSKGTVAGVASVLRGLARFLRLMGHTSEDHAKTIEAPRVYRQHKPARTLAMRDVDRLLDAVDRSSATGKRDYAMLLLGVRYGLRPSDIRGLRLDDVHWRAGHIAIVQAKTGTRLELPLLADVEAALIQHVREGRPKREAREFFLRHKPPYEPLGTTNNLWQVMERGLRAAGLDLVGPGRGMRTLRHTAATQMMRNGVQWETIAGILGHVSSETTRRYAHVDVAPFLASSHRGFRHSSTTSSGSATGIAPRSRC